MPAIPGGKGSSISSRGISLLSKGKLPNVTLSYTGYIKPGSSMTPSNTYQNSQVKFRFVEGVTQVRFAFGEFTSTGFDNTITPNLAGTAEVPGGADVKYTARVFYGTAVDSNTAVFNPGGTTGTGYASAAVTFPTAARTSVTVKAGQIAYSDWITIPAKSVVLLRCAAQWTGTTYGGTSGTGFYDVGSFYNEIWDFGASDLTAGGSIGYGQVGAVCKTAIWAEGKVSANQISRPRVLTIGDSRQGGNTTMEGASTYLCYSFDPINLGIARSGQSFANLNISKSGERLADLVAERWILRPAIAAKCDYVVVQHGFNDLSLGTVAVLNLLREMRVRVNELGAKMIACTIYPNTSSSNTVKGPNDSIRTAINNAIRLSTSVGDIHDGFLECADAIETDATNKATPVRNGGYFIKPDGVYNYDGYIPASGNIFGDETHVSSTGIEIIARKIATQVASVMPLPTY